MTIQCEYPIHYRYRESVEPEGIIVIEDRFFPIRETEHFYWVLPSWQYRVFKNGCMPSYAKNAKKVSKNGIRRKCYPSKEKAMESFLIRKRKQIAHAKRALDLATKVIEANPNIGDVKDIGSCWGKISLGHREFVEDNYSFY